MKIIRRKSKKLFRSKKRGRIRSVIAPKVAVRSFSRRYLYRRTIRSRRKWGRYLILRMQCFLKRPYKFGVSRQNTPFLEFRRFKYRRIAAILGKTIRKRKRVRIYFKKLRLARLVRVRKFRFNRKRKQKIARLRMRGYVRVWRSKTLRHFNRRFLTKNHGFRIVFRNRNARDLLRAYRSGRMRRRRVSKPLLMVKRRSKVYNMRIRLKFIRNQSPYRLVEKRDNFSRNHFIWRLGNLLMRHGSRHHSSRALVQASYYAKQVGLNFFADWLDMQERLRFPFMLKSYYYRGARGVRLVKYVLAKERVDRQYIRSLRFLRAVVFRNQNTAFWLKICSEYEDLMLGERSSMVTGLEQLTLHAIEARGDRLDDKYHRALERLESDPELHFRW